MAVCAALFGLALMKEVEASVSPRRMSEVVMQVRVRGMCPVGCGLWG
jgi:hypothetical protein